ncbi:MAG: Rne/Rng family ribonuclease, partial [Trebonia sp.]
AAFVDIGKGRNAVLYAGEVNFDASGLEGQPKRIESALKAGQSVIVQVTKDPVGHKGARLTSQISLPGRYLVYVPGASMTGISRKLPDTERNRLKHILKKVMPENAGVIVRTAAEGAAEAELDRDVTRLAAQWENIEKKGKTASAPALLHGEPDLTIRVVRDVFNEDFSKLIVSGDEGWEVIDEYVRYVAPHLADRLTRWEGSSEASASDAADDVFAAYRVDEQLAKALDRKVWLPSGGSLVIDRTEAMTVVDVNTGKFTGQGGNLEETVTRNNLEAAEEIVRQLRLRDVGGIVVIDFIDMVLESNRELVLRRLLECLARDRTKHQVAEVTSLGLVQMTRKRVGAGLLEAFSQQCECCNGRGVIVTLEPPEQGHRSTAGHIGQTDSHGGRSADKTAGQQKRAGNGGNGSGSGSGGGSASSSGNGGNGRDASGRDGRDGNGRDSNGHGRGEHGGNEHGGNEHGGRRGRRDRAATSAAVASAVASAAKVSSTTVDAPAWQDADPSDSSSGPAGSSATLSPEDAAPVGDSPAVADAAEEANSAPVGATSADAAGETAPPARRTRTRTRAGSAMARRAQTPEEPVNVVVATVPEVAPDPAPAEDVPNADDMAAPAPAEDLPAAPTADSAPTTDSAVVQEPLLTWDVPAPDTAAEQVPQPAADLPAAEPTVAEPSVAEPSVAEPSAAEVSAAEVPAPAWPGANWSVADLSAAGESPVDPSAEGPAAEGERSGEGYL